MYVLVEQDRSHVDGDERSREHAGEPVQLVDREAREAGYAGPPREPDADADGEGEQQVCDDASGPGHVPDHALIAPSRIGNMFCQVRFTATPAAD